MGGSQTGVQDMKAAVYCGTRNLYGDIIPAVKSLLCNSDVDKIYLLIEDDVFPYELPDCVECINVSDQSYFDHDGPNYKNGWTYMVLMRAALHSVFPKLSKILSLDVDTIVAKDISDLWDLPIDNYYLAGAREPHKSINYLYVNAGVMLLNLDKLRDGKGAEIIDALNTRRFPYNEQDCINELCRGHIYKMSSDYNASDWTEPTTTPKIQHFAAIHRWQNHPLVEMYRNKDWKDICG